jgi:hypothetical protein
MSIDHITHDAGTGKLTCEICKVTEVPPFMPCPINVTVDAMDHFIGKHTACAAPEASEYSKGFDAGVNVILWEIEQWIKQRKFEPRATRPVEQLLEHLKKDRE